MLRIPAQPGVTPAETELKMGERMGAHKSKRTAAGALAVRKTLTELGVMRVRVCCLSLQLSSVTVSLQLHRPYEQQSDMIAGLFS